MSSKEDINATTGSLFSGYGGLELAAEARGFGPVLWHSENDPHASRILAAHWPGVPNLGDITRIDWTQVEPVDVLTGGFPCQDISNAGKREGIDGSRSGLWSYMQDAIRVLRPRLVLVENVGALLGRGMGRVLGDLAAIGYDCRWTCLRASDVGAPHRRERVFIAAYPANDGREWGRPARLGRARPADSGHAPTDAERSGRFGRAPEPEWQQVGRTASARSGQETGAPADTSGERLREHTGEPPAEEAWPLAGHEPPSDRRPRTDVDWGPYAPAIARWEAVIGRPAPRPTEPGRTGERLNPRFVEWMQGLPAGWVTDIDIPRGAQLKALGNGVVPQQAGAAFQLLLAALRVAA